MTVDFACWPHRWLFYQEAIQLMSAHGLPSIRSFQDASWTPPDKSRLIVYLETTPEMVTSAGCELACVFCGLPMSGDSWGHSDGVWVWPHDLAHYVREHAVRLPDAFVSHVRGRNYESTGWDGLRWDTLDWPR